MKMRTRLGLVLTGLACSLGLASTANAWSGKEHIQLTRLAVMRILDDANAPQDLKDWLRANTPLLPSMDAERDYFMTASVGANPDQSKATGLCWWAIVPDNEAQDRSARDNGFFGAHERLMHYIDLEFFNSNPQKRTYQLDLSSLPDVHEIPHDASNEVYRRAGYLPLAREEAYKRLVASIRAGKMVPADDADKDNALVWAGYLAHYTEDNTQPQHATMDYKSAQYFPKSMRNSPNVHAEVEYRMIDDPAQPLPQLRQDFWPLFTAELASIQDDTTTKDLFDSTLQVSMESYKALPLIGTAAAQALKEHPADPSKPEIDTDKFFRFVGDWNGKQASVMQMKAHQLAWAVVRVQHVLEQAWAEAHQGGATTQPAH